MANDAGYGSKNRDNNSNNSKNKLVSKVSSRRDSGKTDRSTRCSVKETSSKQMALSPASKRKSKRLENRTLSMPPAKRKSAGLEQQNTPIPLRRSERCSTSSISRYLSRESNSSGIKEEKRDKIVKKLTMESGSVSTSKKNVTAPVDLKRKRMDGGTCKLLFKNQKKGGTTSVAPPGYMQHIHQVWRQQNLRSSPVTDLSSASEQASAPAYLRSFPINGLSSASQPVESQRTSVSSSPVANCSVHYVETSLPTLIPASVAGLSTSSQPAAGQKTAAVSSSTTVSAGSVSKPRLISAITPSRFNHRLGGDIRAPAPHLQPIRAPTLTPVSSSSTLPNGMQGHPRPLNVAASSPSLPQLASLRSTSLPFQLLQHQIQPPVVKQLPVNLSDSGNTSLDHGLGGLPAIQNTTPMSSRPATPSHGMYV